MDELSAFLERNGEIVLFASVFAQQIGVPIPAIPVLLGAGALAGAGKLNLWVVVALSVAASLPGDLLWYYLGRRRGRRVLATLCRMSLEPDSCVRRTELTFGRYGVFSLVMAKFVPGLSTMAPPLAGIFGMSLPRFLLFAGLGALVYTGTFAGLGYVFSAQLELLAEQSLMLGEGLLLVLGVALAGYVLVKLWQRRRFLMKLRTARIEPRELKERLDGGEEIFIIDLRHPLDVEVEPHHIPGAFHLSPDDLEARHPEIPRDREVVLYCT